MNLLLRNLLFTLLAVVMLAAAGDPSPAPGQDSSTPRDTASAPEAGDAPVAEPTPTPKASPTPTPPATPIPDIEEQLEEFVPSEELRADEAVAFPVDI